MKKTYNTQQLQVTVTKAVNLIKNHHFPVMASRVWDIYRAQNPLCSVVQYWKQRPYNGNPPDFNKLLKAQSTVQTVKVGSNTYYLAL
jgi:hypothetical protein